MLLDIRDATEALKRGDMPTDKGVKAWVEYAKAADSGSGAKTRQKLLWEAHQISLHRGIRNATALYERESSAEKRFIKTVVENVDLSAMYDFPSDQIGATMMDVFLNGIAGIKGSFPSSYPATRKDAEHAEANHVAGFLLPNYRALAYLQQLNLIGLEATQWD